MSNTPSDVELKKLAEECGIGWAAGLGGMDDFLRAFAGAVLAKWGTPQPAPAPATPDGDELRKIARAARTSASDDASPTEYVLAGWRAALAAQE